MGVVRPTVRVCVVRRIIGTVIAAIVVRRIIPPHGIIWRVPVAISIHRASPVEPWVIIRGVIIAHPVRIARIVIVRVLVIDVLAGRVHIFFIVVGLFIRGILPPRST